MSKTAVPASPLRGSASPAGGAVQAKPRTLWHQVRRVLTPLASLQLTVVLFTLSILLVFLGTLAQVDEGIWTVLSRYFRTGLAWIPWQVFVRFGQVFLGVSPDAHLSGSFPYPGGWLLGGLLLLNLLVAHLVRFRLSWKRAGILILHAGLIIMMLSELFTGLFAVEARMTMATGETVNFTDESRQVELAMTDTSDPNTDQVTVIPKSFLITGGRISNDLLPVDVEVIQFMRNSHLVPVDGASAAGKETVAATNGQRYTVVEQAEVSGVAQEQPEDAPAARVAFRKKGTEELLGTYLVSLWFYPNFTLHQRQFPLQSFTLNGKRYTFELRYKRDYKPYQVKLLEFHHDRYIGTDTPRNYSSRVRLTDPTRHEDREILIYMNNPLRYQWETFYQSGVLPGDRGTVLQVVDNPGWLMPYISCAMVSLGMVVHFGLHLLGFLRRRVAL